jgi:NAD kinase
MLKHALLVIKRPMLHELEQRMGIHVRQLKDHDKLCAAAEAHLAAVQSAEETLKARGIKATTMYREDLRAHAKRPRPETYGLVVAVGGDGTFMTAAHHTRGQPYISVNSDVRSSEGGLACCAITDFPRLLDDLLAGKARIEHASRAEVELDGKPLGLALNEVFVGAAKPYHTARYIFRHDGKQEEQKSSGVIISTGTGSTAWYKSAGGKPFPREERKLAWVVREPFHGRLTGCKYDAGDVKPGEELIIESLMYAGMVALDGQEDFPFERGSVLKVRVAGEPLRMVRFR